MVSIDTMGCQKEIAVQIIDNHGRYLLAVKDNQKTLHEDIKMAFKVCHKEQKTIYETLEINENRKKSM